MIVHSVIIIINYYVNYNHAFFFLFCDRYVSSGGRVLMLVGEGGETRFNTNVNFLLEDFGIMVNSDAVVRTVYDNYMYPKEVYIYIS